MQIGMFPSLWPRRPFHAPSSHDLLAVFSPALAVAPAGRRWLPSHVVTALAEPASAFLLSKLPLQDSLQSENAVKENVQIVKANPQFCPRKPPREVN